MRISTAPKGLTAVEVAVVIGVVFAILLLVAAVTRSIQPRWR